MRDYIKNSKQVDMFLGSIDPVIIEFQFSNHPKVIFKKALEIITNLAEKFVYEAIPKSKAVVGRKQFDPLFMMQVIIVARRFGLTDKEMEIQLKTDILIQYLLGFKAIDYKALPSAKTIWKYRNLFEKAGFMRTLFELSVDMNYDFDYEVLNTEDLIIDSSFCIVPRQRNTREENQIIKDGKGNELWNDNVNKKRHKDIDATWTKKRNETFYGYKAHVKCGVLSKVIYEVFTTTASTNDSKIIIPLLEWRDTDKKLYLDAGYYGAESLEKIISDYRIELNICERAFRGHPLTEEQKQSNRVKSKKRCRIEHVFGFIEQSMKGFIARTMRVNTILCKL